MSATYNYVVPTVVSWVFGSYKNEESRYRWVSTPGFHTLSTVPPLVSKVVLQMNIVSVYYWNNVNSLLMRLGANISRKQIVTDVAGTFIFCGQFVTSAYVQ